MPEWSIGSWRLVDVYTFDNQPKMLRDHHKLSLSPLIGKQFANITSRELDLSPSPIVPKHNTEISVTPLKTGAHATYPGLSATSVTSGRKMDTRSLTPAVFVEAGRCFNQDDRSDHGIVPCVSPVVAKAGSERVIVYFASTTTKPSSATCLWELRRPRQRGTQRKP